MPPTAAPTGTATFILKYRLGEYGFPAPLQDVVRAMRMLRSRASDGFSRAEGAGSASDKGLRSSEIAELCHRDAP